MCIRDSIDTLVYNFFCDNDYFANKNIENYTEILLQLFDYLKSQNKDQTYWYAVGSNQQVYNSDNGKFVSEAKSALKKLNEAIKNESIDDTLSELFGTVYSNNSSTYVSKVFESKCNDTEEFIDNKFPVDIRYSLKIDCIVSQNGFRDKLLSFILSTEGYLALDKKLTFKIVNTDCTEPYDIYWKVRNVGDEAIRRNMIRGNIVKTNSKTKKESTNFKGPHYVECFLVKNGVCVAKDKIDVPIKSY